MTGDDWGLGNVLDVLVSTIHKFLVCLLVALCGYFWLHAGGYF